MRPLRLEHRWLIVCTTLGHQNDSAKTKAEYSVIYILSIKNHRSSVADWLTTSLPAGSVHDYLKQRSSRLFILTTLKHGVFFLPVFTVTIQY